MEKRIPAINLLRSYILLSCIFSLASFGLLIKALSSTGITVLFASPWTGILLTAFLGVSVLVFFILALAVFRISTSGKLLNLIEQCLHRSFIRTTIFLISIYLYIFGSIYWLSSSPVIYGPTYPVWLVPAFIWLTTLSLLTLIHLALLHSDHWFRNITRLVLLLGILTTGILVNLQFWSYDSPRKEDIYFTYLDGERLLEGVNPYERVLTGDMQVNDKYSTYFPIFYYLSWGTQRLGFTAFAEWLSFWRIVFLLANLSIALLLYYIPDRQQILALAFFAPLFWMFNRWTLHVAKTADIDFLPIFLMLLSLFLYRRYQTASFLMLGLSLGIKQMAIFLIPLYLIWVWNDSQLQRVKNVFVAAILIAAIPIIVSLPFIAWNWEGFYRSILFSATRDAAAAFDVFSLDVVLGLKGIPAKIPLLIMLFAVYWLVWRRQISRYIPAFLCMTVFVLFNSVMFTSYMVWMVALIPLVAYEFISEKELKRVDLIG